MEEIVLTIPRDRTKPVQVEVNGCIGSSCEIRTRGLESALGGRVQKELKPEYHEQPVETSTSMEVA